MYRIALVNMPLAALRMPSLALTQLRSTVTRELGGRVRADVHYLNHDFAHFLTLPAYKDLVSFEHHPSGLGEWFFRPVAFPGEPDNAEAYFTRYYPQHTPRNRLIRDFVTHKRRELAAHFDSLIDRYGLDQVEMVGFTSMFSQNVASIGMARRIKARNPDVVVVLGGANCEGEMGRVVADQVDAVDYVFSGPSLKSFPHLVRLLMEGDAEGTHRVDGVFTRRNQAVFRGCSSGAPEADGAVTVKAFGEETDINDPVEVDYEPFLDAYEASFPGERKPQLFFETSRGCWWGERAHCTFCGLNGSTIGYRAMRPELAFSVFNQLFSYAGRCAELSSVDNILPKSYLTDVLPYLDTPESTHLFYEVKADLDEDDFRVLAKSRVLSIQPGIESLNTGTLKLMRKGTSSFQNLQFLINCVRYGISPAWNLLIGFPREEIDVYEKYEADIPLLSHLPPPGGVFPIRFDRFSPYYEEAAEYGLDLHPLDWYALTYPWDEALLERLAYYFADHNYGAPYAVNAAKMMMRLRDLVNRWTAQWQGKTVPRLELRAAGGRTTVFDSRSGTNEEYPLGDGARRLLEALATPKKVVNLAKELPGVDVEAELEGLRARRLVFQENDRILSLIVPPRTPITVPLGSTDFAAAAA